MKSWDNEEYPTLNYLVSIKTEFLSQKYDVSFLTNISDSSNLVLSKALAKAEWAPKNRKLILMPGH